MTKILTLKTIVLVVIVMPLLFSCSKKEGCNFNEAINYDNKVIVDDGSCTFTNFTFYADTSKLSGVFVKKIDVKIDNKLIGSFTGMESSKTACGGANIASYTPTTVEQISWISEIHFQDTIIVTSGLERTSPNIECLEIDVLP